MVYKIKITTDLRRYTARGSQVWKEIYKERSSVERVTAYLKEFFQLNNVRFRTGIRCFATLIYNAAKLASDRIHQKLQSAANKVVA
jgi:transposase